MPHASGERITLAHGEGGRLARRLIRAVLLDSLNNELLRPMADAALLPEIDGRIAMTTDSYVVSPLFFPGGDIGKLAVHGAVNDLAVMGAKAMYLSLGLIIEEGLLLGTLRDVVQSIREAAGTCGVQVVTGDTKVVPRGAADGLFVNTTAIGRLEPGIDLGPHRVHCGDLVLVSGTIGEHGVAILSAREQLGFETLLESDTAPVHELIQSLFNAGIDVHFMRDPTRGGVSAALHELADAAGVSVVLEEDAVPLSPSVRGACELLGLDPLHVPNEGKVVAIVEKDSAGRALACMHAHPLGQRAAIIGEITDDSSPQVLVRGPLQSLRVLDEPAGSPLPRIC